ncbi:sensor histidine kinase [Kordia sp. YSTF-M3]|uniref:Oxygen sensor histidine kinase NreB n=1 Tax=Kordia aestuariivivens TaxID=2759037 RepID=A0ABR7QDP5_9FLAO|nr:sensor histidine kinase [Kordia aestuariivivens]MBC8756633.1 sensor histidine kinase [Kordia aestuariivivens]
MRIEKIKYLILISAFFLNADFSYAQNLDFENVWNAFDSDNNNKILETLQAIDTINSSDQDIGTWYFYYADYQLRIDNQHIAYDYALKSKQKFNEANLKNDVKDCNLLILDILNHQNDIKVSKDDIVEELYKYAQKENDSTLYRSIYRIKAVEFLDKKDAKNSILYFNKVIEVDKHLNDTLQVALTYMNIGTVYAYALKNADSALIYTKKAIPVLKKNKDFKNLAHNYNNQAYHYELKKNYLKAIEYYKKADSIPLKKNIAKTKVIFYENMADTYEKAKDYKNAAIYLKKFINLKDSIGDEFQNIAINETNSKYNTKTISADLSKLQTLYTLVDTERENEKKRKNSQLIISLIVLALVIISAYLIQKNTRKKQLLAEQAKDLEAQKVSTLLKEQELSSIDAMIEGQEKERKRIAEDLHDDLGALMATVKLHFENIETAQNEDAVTKTSSLLDEAYDKIRTIAHAKNAGVIANQGLLVAVTNMSAKISSANKMNIEVISFGLEERLENSLELSLFRMIQELIANIIKHSEATNATIQLTQHEKNLNIIVEDNGKGFDPSNNKSSGIGLETIKKRVEHLNGKLSIDSTLGKGTTILVDVPLL